MDVKVLRRVGGLFVGLAIGIPLVLLMFIAPASRGTPHDLPIGVAGSDAQVELLKTKLDGTAPGAFRVERFDSQDALEAATGDREIYGGFAISGDRPPQVTTVIASGGGAAPAALLTQVGTQVAAGLAAGAGAAPGAAPGTPGAQPPAGPVAGSAQAPSPVLVDVAPPARDDPRGAGFGAVVMPVFLAGAILGIALTQLARRAKLIAALLPVGAMLVGATAVGAAMAVGVLPGGFWAQWLAMSAGILAIGAAVAGIVSLVGIAGMGIAVLVFMLAGMPLAGVGAPPEYLPWNWGRVGQGLPLGATGTALRSAAFFADGALVGPGAGAAYAVLAGWIVIGYALLAASVVKRRRLVGELDEAVAASGADVVRAA